jgi:hypothetical protein
MNIGTLIASAAVDSKTAEYINKTTEIIHIIEPIATNNLTISLLHILIIFYTFLLKYAT